MARVTPPYKAKVWRLPGTSTDWRARRPVAASIGPEGYFYRVERRRFATWDEAMLWCHDARPRPVWPAQVAAHVDQVADLLDAFNYLATYQPDQSDQHESADGGIP